MEKEQRLHDPYDSDIREIPCASTEHEEYYKRTYGERGLNATELQSCHSMSEALRRRVKKTPSQVIYRWVNEKGVEDLRLTAAEILEKAERIAAILQNKYGVVKGDLAALCFLPSIDFIITFWGCTLAGVVAVPVYPPNPRNPETSVPRFTKIVQDANCKVILTHKEYYDKVYPYTVALLKKKKALGKIVGRRGREELKGNPWPKLPWHTVDKDKGTYGVARAVPQSRAEVCFLQYTSGSTGDPKGVMVTHGNLLEEILINGFAVAVGWIPQYHDMGLIAGYLSGTLRSATTVFFSPMTFLRQPTLYIDLLSRYKGQFSGAPNFSLELCARRYPQERLHEVDLSALVLVGMGGEPCRRRTVQVFSEKFATTGLGAAVATPSYGMAENTLHITNHDRGAARSVSIDPKAYTAGVVKVVADDDPTGVSVMGNGGAIRCDIAIVNYDTCEACSPMTVGEIWTRGPRKAVGYFNRPEKTAETFDAVIKGREDDPDTWLRTGDQGFIYDGELFISGRIKDMLIIRGVNYYPNDIEGTVELAHEQIRPGCCAAFIVEQYDQELLVVATEVRSSSSNLDKVGIVEAIERHVQREHDLSMAHILLIQERTIPKTSSGKIRRRETKEEFLKGNLRTVYECANIQSSGRCTAASGVEDGVVAQTSTKGLKALVFTWAIGADCDAVVVALYGPQKYATASVLANAFKAARRNLGISPVLVLYCKADGAPAGGSFSGRWNAAAAAMTGQTTCLALASSPSCASALKSLQIAGTWRENVTIEELEKAAGVAAPTRTAAGLVSQPSVSQEITGRSGRLSSLAPRYHFSDEGSERSPRTPSRSPVTLQPPTRSHPTRPDEARPAHEVLEELCSTTARMFDNVTTLLGALVEQSGKGVSPEVRDKYGEILQETVQFRRTFENIRIATAPVSSLERTQAESPAVGATPGAGVGGESVASDSGGALTSSPYEAEVVGTVIAAFKEVALLDDEDLEPEQMLNKCIADIGVTSVSFMDMIGDVQDNLGIFVPSAIAFRCETVSDFVKEIISLVDSARGRPAPRASVPKLDMGEKPAPRAAAAPSGGESSTTVSTIQASPRSSRRKQRRPASRSCAPQSPSRRRRDERGDSPRSKRRSVSPNPERKNKETVRRTPSASSLFGRISPRVKRRSSGQFDDDVGPALNQSHSSLDKFDREDKSPPQLSQWHSTMSRASPRRGERLLATDRQKPASSKFEGEPIFRSDYEYEL
eukprot:CAMPEP_0119121436 /NCGR_PEP_ID=MMETSP1310-20130426/2066_1 /TAXON_ID=464262 /ORGANISM="Genus nov. species nov., Strain RCC2339" /LENGTH=1227 /DNA_ID=CAMNT_0007110999 /DNA_START=49 /DNA_END=3732 /DNA_ORIENTATION=+